MSEHTVARQHKTSDRTCRRDRAEPSALSKRSVCAFPFEDEARWVARPVGTNTANQGDVTTPRSLLRSYTLAWRRFREHTTVSIEFDHRFIQREDRFRRILIGRVVSAPFAKEFSNADDIAVDQIPFDTRSFAKAEGDCVAAKQTAEPGARGHAFAEGKAPCLGSFCSEFGSVRLRERNALAITFAKHLDEFAFILRSQQSRATRSTIGSFARPVPQC